MSHWEAPGRTDSWHTPKYIFDAMHPVTFDLDVAAPAQGPRHVPCRRWLHHSALDVDWDGFVWMNPPFGGRNGIAPWLEKFAAHGDGIALVPDRTSAPWFRRYVPRGHHILFLSPKVKFERDDGSLGASPSTGTVLFGMGEHARKALWRAKFLGTLALVV